MFGGLAGNPDQAETLPFDVEPHVEGLCQPAPNPSDDSDTILRAKTLRLGEIPSGDDAFGSPPPAVEPEPAPVGGDASQTLDKPAGDKQVVSDSPTDLPNAEQFDAMNHQAQKKYIMLIWNSTKVFGLRY